MGKKIDKGFKVIYWGLSYRRKFIRTLWMIPITIIAVVFFAYSGYLMYGYFTPPVVFTAIALFIGHLIQAIYTYKKWKKEEKSEKDKERNLENKAD